MLAPLLRAKIKKTPEVTEVLFFTFVRLFDSLIIMAVVPLALVGGVLGLALLGHGVLISVIRARLERARASIPQPSSAQVSGFEPCSCFTRPPASGAVARDRQREPAAERGAVVSVACGGCGIVPLTAAETAAVLSQSSVCVSTPLS